MAIASCIIRGDFWSEGGNDGARSGLCVHETRGQRVQRWRKDFLTSLIEWEIKVAAHEVASGDRIRGRARVTRILDRALEAVKITLRQAPGPEGQCECSQELNSRSELRVAWTLGGSCPIAG